MDIITSIRTALSLPSVSKQNQAQVEAYLSTHTTYTKKEGNDEHVNVFFLPYDHKAGQIYLGHHKKANDWIPPGGHIEPGETPIAAAIREMKEELNFDIKPEDLELFNLSYKYIGRPEVGCQGHYDLWYLVHISSHNNFIFDHGEYYGARWFKIKEGLAHIANNPDFVTIINQSTHNSLYALAQG